MTTRIIDVTRAIKLSGLKLIIKMFNRDNQLWDYNFTFNKQENILKLSIPKLSIKKYNFSNLLVFNSYFILGVLERVKGGLSPTKYSLFMSMHYINEITGSKLPSNIQVLRTLDTL
jgi:hypothetical protein